MTAVWIGATVSALGALVAWLSANRANKLADGLDRRRHMIEAHDHEVEEFHENFATFVQRLGATSKFEDLKSPLFAAELVFAHPLCTPELERALGAVLWRYLEEMAKRVTSEKQMEELLSEMRKEMRAINESAAARRAALVAGLTGH
jgi:hypothetical protein